MIFSGKVLSEISDEEISQLVKEHLGERQHLEYKLTINHKSENDVLETLCDIAALANVGGGYLIVGIRDDGKGHAQKFESVKNPERVKQSILSLCIDYIVERIEGLEADCRNVDGHDIVIVGIPNSSRMPHMVTYQNNTHFIIRHHDGKREMTIGEIRAAFTENLFGRKLTFIENGIRNILNGSSRYDKEIVMQQLIKGEVSILNIIDGAVISEYYQKQVLNHFEHVPLFYISITPTKANKSLIDIGASRVKSLLDNPPNQREYGWNMRMFARAKLTTDGLYRGDPEEKILILVQNGHMTFYSLLDTLFCYQNEEQFKQQPRLYPYAITEFPCSFLRLYKAIIDDLGLTGSYIIKMRYHNLKGYMLLPYQPDNIGYLLRMSLLGADSPHPYRETKLMIPDETVNSDFNPDKVTFDLLKHVYGAYGYTSDMIPFYDRNTEMFNFGT